MLDEYVVVLSTLPVDAEPSRIAKVLVEERLAACVNILPPMTSVYRWTDAIEEDTEHQMVIKTARVQLPALWDRIRDLHPYDMPEFIVLPIIDGNDAYLKWIGDSVGPAKASEA